MRASWLLMFFMVQAGNLFKALDGSLLGWIEPEDPSCEDLRKLWNTVRQSVRMSEFTNEIPLMPWEVFSYVDNHHRKSGRQKHFKSEQFQNANLLQDTPPEEGTFANSRYIPATGHVSFSVPHGQQASFQQEPNEIFDSFNGPTMLSWEARQPVFSPSTALSGTKKKGGGEIMHSPSWGIPDEVGMFGRFVDFDEDVPVITRNQDIKQSAEDWPGPVYPPPSYSSPGKSCLQVANGDCTVDEECACAGWITLRCHHGKCSNQRSGGEKNEYGMWHDGPLPRSKLGLLRKLQKRSNKSIFM